MGLFITARSGCLAERKGLLQQVRRGAGGGP